jgi:hypothetical protein
MPSSGKTRWVQAGVSGNWCISQRTHANQTETEHSTAGCDQGVRFEQMEGGWSKGWQTGKGNFDFSPLKPMMLNGAD